MSTDDDMLHGYLDGYDATEAEFPDRLSNRGAAYRHGWLNGRDDRMRKPRASAAELRNAAKIAEETDRLP